MASIYPPRIITLKVDSAVSLGMVVKHGTDDVHVVKSAAATNKHIGLAQNAPTTAEDMIEVALPGGGAKGLAGGTIARGDFVTSDSNGKLVATTTADDRHVGYAMQSAVSGDIFEVYVTIGRI